MGGNPDEDDGDASYGEVYAGDHGGASLVYESARNVRSEFYGLQHDVHLHGAVVEVDDDPDVGREGGLHDDDDA